MSQKTKTSLKAGVASNFPDNTSGAISPLVTRTQHIDEIDSALNLLETALQTVTGQVNFTGGLQVSGANITASPFILIIQESDFPTQDATTITLESKKIYVLGANLTTAKYFVCQDGAVMTGFNILGYTLTCTGTGSMFTGTDATFSIRRIQKNHPTAQGYSFTDTVGGQKLFIEEEVRTVSGTKYGTFNDMQTVLIENSSALDVDDGIDIQGINNTILSFSKLFMQSTSATFKGIDFGTAISRTIEVDNLIIEGPAGSIGISGLAGSGNVPAGRLATVKSSEFGANVTPLQNITNSDVRWSFKDNTPISDTITDALLSLNSNATATVITTASTPVKIAGTWVVERESRTTGTTGGRVTFNSERDEVLPIDGAVFVEPVSGTNKLIKCYFALNGAIIANSGQQIKTDAGNPLSIPMTWQHDFSGNDYLELWVENNTDDIDILVSYASLRVR